MFKKKPIQQEVDTAPGETDEMPVVPYRVLYAGLPFYSDPECRNEIPDAKLAILKPLDPEGRFGDLDVVPTRKVYQQGQLVRWWLNKDKMWEDCWYRNPETGQIEKPFTAHVEFVGPLISARAIEKDRARLEEIERKVSASSKPAGEVC